MAGRLHQDTRFFCDPGFPRARSEDLYRVWIERSCTNQRGKVFVAEAQGKPAAYIACSAAEAESGQIELIAVEEALQGQGVGRALVNTALGWFAAQRIGHVTVVTQGRNIRAQRLYQKCGFVIQSLQLWYHLWFNPRRPSAS